MTETNTSTAGTTGQEATPEKNTGLPEGVSKSDTAAYQTAGINDVGVPQPPVMSNTPPAKEETKQEQKVDTSATADKPADKIDYKQANTDAVDANTYVEYNHPAADAAVTLIKSKGIEPIEAAAWFKDVVDSGDMSKIDVAAIEKRLGKQDAALVVASVKQYYSETLEVAKKTADEIYKEVGSKDNFAKVVDWANKNMVSKPEYKELFDMLNKGGKQSVLAARELVTLYNNSPDNSTLTTGVVQGDGTLNSNLQLISRQDYNKELKVAYAKGDTAQIAQLNARRKASIGKL